MSNYWWDFGIALDKRLEEFSELQDDVLCPCEMLALDPAPEKFNKVVLEEMEKFVSRHSYDGREHTLPLDRFSYGDLITISDWHDAIYAGSLSSWDGSGHPVIDGRVFHNQNAFYDCTGETTHVIWFNN